MDDDKQRKKTEVKRARQPKISWTKVIRRLSSWTLFVLIIGLITMGAMYVYLRAQPLPIAYIPQTSQILDYHGEVIDTFHSGENRQVVDLEQISPHLINATLAIEDHRFFSHLGFDLIGIGRAAWVDLKHMSMAQGASSITQQLARNLYLTHEKTWTRKVKEALFAVQLEMKYNKKEILKQYLNQIYYGHATYGIQTAARLYFDKDAKDLTMAESALLAGVPKGPKYYSPYMDEASALARQGIVLQAMVTHRYISQSAADEARKEELVFKPLKGRQASEAPYFRDYVRQQAMVLLGLDEEVFNEGGFVIHTTLDLRMQRIAEEIIEKRLHETELQVALVAIDPRNGFVKAMVGGRNYEHNQYNRVFATTRQPGSSFKPIVYLTALEQEDFSAVTQFRSEPTVFSYDEGKETYSPRNYGNRYSHDFIDLRKAVSTSDNVFAVHTILAIGAEKVIEMARRLGIQSKMSPLPSLALGTYPVSPFDLTSAFATIANEGNRHEPVVIESITDGRGKVLYESKTEFVNVIAPAYTYVLTSLMEGVFDPGGTGHRVASLIKRPVAAKTGTTNYDAWMAGFTPELSTTVWVGHDRDRNISAVEALLPAPIFAEFTERALEQIPPKLFPVPDDVISLYIDPMSGKIATANCPTSRLEHFVKGTEPIEYCTDHRTVLEEVEGVHPLELDFDGQHGSWWNQLKQWWNE